MDHRLFSKTRRRTGYFFILIILAVAVAIPWYTHNDLTEKKESVRAAWANIQSTLQRRADLIPALLKTVRETMEYESETLSNLAEQQAKMLSGHTSTPSASSDELRTLAAIDRQLAVGSRKLLLAAGALPELRATDQFMALQSQLEGTENRISVARIRYNNAVRHYNSAIEGFIGRHIADSLEYESKPYFEANSKAQTPVTLEFQ